MQNSKNTALVHVFFCGDGDRFTGLDSVCCPENRQSSLNVVLETFHFQTIKQILCSLSSCDAFMPETDCKLTECTRNRSSIFSAYDCLELIWLFTNIAQGTQNVITINISSKDKGPVGNRPFPCFQIKRETALKYDLSTLIRLLRIIPDVLSHVLIISR